MMRYWERYWISGGISGTDISWKWQANICMLLRFGCQKRATVMDCIFNKTSLDALYIVGIQQYHVNVFQAVQAAWLMKSEKGVISHSCPNFSGDLTKPLLKLRYGWVLETINGII